MAWHARYSGGSFTLSGMRYVGEGGGVYRVIKIVAEEMEKKCYGGCINGQCLTCARTALCGLWAPVQQALLIYKEVYIYIYTHIYRLFI